MPIEVDQKKLKNTYLFVNIYSIILMIAPFVAIIRLFTFFYFGHIASLIEVCLIGITFPLVAKFWFTKLRQINFLFMGKYYGDDRAKLLKRFTWSNLFIERFWLKLPLPYFELNNRAKKWRKDNGS